MRMGSCRIKNSEKERERARIERMAMNVKFVLKLGIDKNRL